MKSCAVVFKKAAHNWAAYVPDLPGCVTTGRTIEETRSLIAEAIEFHIEGMRKSGKLFQTRLRLWRRSRFGRHSEA